MILAPDAAKVNPGNPCRSGIKALPAASGRRLPVHLSVPEGPATGTANLRHVLPYRLPIMPYMVCIMAMARNPTNPPMSMPLMGVIRPVIADVLSSASMP